VLSSSAQAVGYRSQGKWDNIVDTSNYDQHIDTNVREVDCLLRMFETRNTCNIFLIVYIKKTTLYTKSFMMKVLVFCFRVEGCPVWISLFYSMLERRRIVISMWPVPYHNIINKSVTLFTLWFLGYEFYWPPVIDKCTCFVVNIFFSIK